VRAVRARTVRVLVSVSAGVSTFRLVLLNELTDGVDVDQVLIVREAERRPRRDGGEYLRLQLGDRTGAVVCMVWEELAEVQELVRAGEPVRVLGRWRPSCAS
jgi:3'-5' exoribonuclease